MVCGADYEIDALKLRFSRNAVHAMNVTLLSKSL